MAKTSGCHGDSGCGRVQSLRGGALQTLALLGPPNTGKSTLYNRLTGGHALIANWPGLTIVLALFQGL